MALLQMLRKEFSQARMLSIAQAQFLRAHDEIKMSTSRLRLKESEDEPSEVNILAREELVQLNMQFSSDKFLALPTLHRIKGQLRYLKVVYCFCLIIFCFIFVSFSFCLIIVWDKNSLFSLLTRNEFKIKSEPLSY